MAPPSVVVSLTALAYPSASIYLLFLPFIPIKIGWGVLGVIAFDVTGIIKGWKIFDHVAHLGGVAFGGIYYLYGPWMWKKIQQLEEVILPQKEATILSLTNKYHSDMSSKSFQIAQLQAEVSQWKEKYSKQSIFQHVATMSFQHPRQEWIYSQGA